MFDFDVNHYISVVNEAIALRPQIEQAVDEICKKGYSNIFLIGCGGTYAHSLPMKYWIDSTTNKIEIHSMIAAEFMIMGHKAFSENSVCVFSTRTGNTKEIIDAIKMCKAVGARTVVYVSNDNTPVCEYADYKFYSPAEDPNLCEAIYSFMICLLGKFLKNCGAFDDYDDFIEEYAKITPYLLKIKENMDEVCQEYARHIKDFDYHMVVGSGMLWGEAYDYAMCILEEMQWLKTKSIHAAEFFHGTLELVEDGTSMILLYGDDETRPLMDRVRDFARKYTKEIIIFDTASVDLPFTEQFYRKIVSPMIIYCMEERLSAYLAKERNHDLTIRRYYRQMEY